MSKLYKYFITAFIAIFTTGMVSSCMSQEDNLNSGSDKTEVKFDVYVHDEASLQTKAATEISATDYNNVPFYVSIDYPGAGGTDETQTGIYLVTPGLRGQFSPQNSSSAINWNDRTNGHIFHSWNYFTQNQGSGTYDPTSLEPATIYFNYDDNGNSELEKFIGAVAGPYVYEQQGQYVPLHFYHLVSKINFVRFRVFNYDVDNAFGFYTNPGVKITLYGLPSEGTFYPHPANDSEGNPVMPYVAGSTQPDAVTFNMGEEWQNTFVIPNGGANYPSGGGNAPLYICPGYDFRNIKFKVEITTPNWNYSTKGPFYGSFGDFSFTGRTDKNDTEPVLRAGEVMNISIYLYPEGGTGGGITITPWQTLDDADGTSYPRPGIYQDSEIESMTSDNVNWAELFEILGSTEDGEKIFNVYNNLQLSGNVLEVPDDYILDGLGHLITIPEDFSDISVSNVRDIYFTNGTNTIWIDEDGNVWIQQEDGAFVRTTSTIEDSPLSFSPESYTLYSE